MTLYFFAIIMGVIAYAYPLFSLGLLSLWRTAHLRKILLLFISGWLYAYGYAAFFAQWNLPKNQEGQVMQVQGVIVTSAKIEEHIAHFMLRTKEYGLVRLSWFNTAPILSENMRCDLKVKLKRPRGFLNPGSIDEVHLAMAEGVHATGYVKSGTCYPSSSSVSLRARLQTQLEKLPDPMMRFIEGLTIGVRDAFQPTDWSVLRSTGTNHLFVIAGLHIGLLSLLIYSIVNKLWRCFPRFMLWMPAQLAATCAAFVMAFIYSFLAGFSLPTQRACIMACVFCCSVLLKRKLLPWHAFMLALLIVLLLNPFAVYTSSFWLSFIAVAAIIYLLSGRIRAVPYRWLKLQLLLAFALMPLGFFYFEQTSLIAPIANLIIVPWVGFVVVPLSVLSLPFLVIFPPIAHGLLFLATHAMAVAWWFLNFCAQLPGSNIMFSFHSSWQFIFLCLAMLLILSPAFFPARYVGFIFLIAVFFYKPTAIKDGHFKVSVLDVGQGLSTVVQTAHHALVFDTGAKFSPTFDIGSAVLLPYLHHEAIANVDLLVISHGDNDHSGGAQSLLAGMHVNAIKTSVPARFAQSTLCLQGENFTWDGVQFKFLYPAKDTLHLGNNSSCVLKITGESYSVLMTGDIEAWAEYALLRSGELLKSTVLIAPHHGSKTSSSVAFLKAVQPSLVIVSSGYLNRFHFPSKEIIRRYQVLNITMRNTAKEGMIILE